MKGVATAVAKECVLWLLLPGLPAAKLVAGPGSQLCIVALLAAALSG